MALRLWGGSAAIAQFSSFIHSIKFNGVELNLMVNEEKNFNLLIFSIWGVDESNWYYNSNLYEADSYLVIIIECFCEEWTNTWNWLRRELVAELPQAAVGEMNGLVCCFWFVGGYGRGTRQCSATKEKTNKQTNLILFLFHQLVWLRREMKRCDWREME